MFLEKSDDMIQFKYFSDRVIAVLLIIILLPILMLLCFIVNIKLGKPVFFKQIRPGLKGKIFGMYKFRSMTSETDTNGELLPDEIRLTRFGKILRASSLDELPELINIIKGEMSFVGPRPLLVEYLEFYSDEQMKRHNMKPGITGWAQVNGRNAISWEEKFELDVWYVENWSIWVDIKILFLTVYKVLRRDGVSQEGHVTMEKFKGTKG